MGKIIGISLGTTNSVAAVMQDGEPVVIPSATGERVVPSAVAVNENHERLIGRAARSQVLNSENMVFHIRQFMGRKYNDPEVQQAIARVPYTVSQTPNGDVCVILDGKEYFPSEISAMILGALKANAEAYLGEPVTRAVIAVPPWFNDSQRQATKDAGRFAGLDVLRIINEPTAAALAYGLHKKENETILVFDLGGGTFNVSILKVNSGVFEVEATNGDDHLGGDDWDERIVNWIADEVKKEQGADLRRDRRAFQRLRDSAEKAKIELSTMTETEIDLPYITADTSVPKHRPMKLTRAKFEQLTTDLMERLKAPFCTALRESNTNVSDIDEVVLVGGATRMPMVQELVRSLTNQEPHQGISPDEVIAIGAAIQADVLGGETKDILLLDVTPLSLGIRTAGNLFRPLISRNTTIPCQTSLIFTTATDFQTKMTIEVLQGECPLADRDKTLGVFVLDGLPAAPRGAIQVKVTLDIDANGILNVVARDLATGREHTIVLKPSKGLSSKEVQQEIAWAGQFARDIAANQAIQTLENARRLVYVARHLEADLSSRISPELAHRLRVALATLDQAWHGPPEALSAATNQLSRLLSEVFLAMETVPRLRARGLGVAGARPAERVGGENPLAGFHVLAVKQGGMGKVTIVLKEGRRFAVKTPRDDLLRDQDAVRRFVAEARTWMSLGRHTNIVCALLVRQTGGRPFLFLEYADGGDLGQWVGKLPVHLALDFAIQFCTGMSYAYGKAGIVHRDIKPANALLSQDGRFRYGYAVKVTDFGLAGAWQPAASEELNLIEAQLSCGMGTWPYMPPEQFSEGVRARFGLAPRPVTVRSDLYALGALMYELFTGELPYHAVSDIFTASPENPRLKNPALPEGLAGLTLHCLAKLPEERYDSFDEVLRELTRIYEQVTGEPYVVKGKPEELTHLDWIARGASLVAVGDNEEGQRCYERALTLAPAFPPAWQGKGLCLEARDYFAQAIQCYDSAIQANPYLEEALCGKARCLAQQNRFGQAVACYEHAYEAQLLTSIGPQ